MLSETSTTVRAPDTVFALSRQGVRTVHCGGTAPAPAGRPRDLLRHELGSASKTFTGLLLAGLVAEGKLSYEDRAADLLAPGRPVHPHLGAVTLRHLITHTSGLPALPPAFYPQALPRWSTAPYAGFPAERVVESFLAARPRRAPGTRWRYSNFAVSVLGHALTAATRTPWEPLLHRRLFAPLGLDGTSACPGREGVDATGHRRDGTPVPPLDIGGFAGAGAVRSTPHDLLTFLEAHLAAPAEAAGPLATALDEVRRPVLRRGPTHAHTHSLTWFVHPTPLGPAYFHAGATQGQQAFIGFRPATGTAVAALCTRRVRLSGDPFVPTAYALLTGEA
ncbi:serine hydrolase [uncultured Streptomyces sp.]|uniref:serine hydrolase domain-containing protein n=1 Tax=uncultured Streptomyces sp. TaxID=174707 RepID=UPI0026054174|nr:serine hydrolase domain-containing protein [uncultured Streptomyces sp.]